MKDVAPTMPADLDPLARNLLDRLQAHAEARNIILGGYFALKHYVDYRPTHDIDAWWTPGITSEQRKATVDLLRKEMEKLGQDHGLEGLRDNIGAKMNALVDRGFPRDFRDIYTLIDRAILSVREAWEIWQEKNPGVNADAAKAQALRRFESILLRRPLEKYPEPERSEVGKIRKWTHEVLLKPTRQDEG